MHDRVSVNALCFLGESMEAVADHWRELSPRRVSVISYQILGEALPQARAVLDEAGYGVETVTHGFMTAAPLSDCAARDAATRSLSSVVQAAQAVGARSIYMLTGGRGTFNWQDAAAAFAEAVAPCRAEAEAAGVAILIEPAPVLYADIHLTHSLRDTLQLAEMAGIGVCIDIFSCWTEAGLADTIARAGPRIGLVQVGDYVLGDRSIPCRAVVGDGVIPMAQMFGWILESGYEGAFDLELMGPRIENVGRVEAARRSAARTGEILQALGA